MQQSGVEPWSQRAPATVPTRAPLIDGEHLWGEPKPPSSIAEIVTWSDRLSTLSEAVRAAGLSSVLSACGTLTLLAPTDRAFARLPEGVLSQLMEPENRDHLQSLLLYHITPGAVCAARLRAVERLMTPQGSSVPVRWQNEEPTVGGAAILWPDVAAANGVVHLIDRVLLPPPDLRYVA